MTRTLLSVSLLSSVGAAILLVRTAGKPNDPAVPPSAPLEVSAAAAHDLDAAPDAPPSDDPEALSAWFEARVLRELERDPGRKDGRPSPPADSPGSTAPRRLEAGEAIGAVSAAAHARDRVASAAGRSRGPNLGTGGEASEELARELEQLRERANWDYLEDVFQGRVSGIPNEQKAGVSLQEMDRLGEIPFVEELRREGRIEELRRLGLGPRVEPLSLLNPRLAELLEREGRIPPPPRP